MKNFLGYIYLLLIAGLIFSCNKKTVEIPANVLPQKEMIPLLIDIHLAQSAINVTNISDSVKYNMNDYTAYILKSHNISREKYIASVAFYSEHPELMQVMYQEIVDELSKMQNEVQRK